MSKGPAALYSTLVKIIRVIIYSSTREPKYSSRKQRQTKNNTVEALCNENTGVCFTWTCKDLFVVSFMSDDETSMRLVTSRNNLTPGIPFSLILFVSYSLFLFYISNFMKRNRELFSRSLMAKEKGVKSIIDPENWQHRSPNASLLYSCFFPSLFFCLYTLQT